MYCIVLHIGIYLYCTNGKETHKSYACFQHANTRSGRMFGRVCMLKASAGLVCLFAICTIFIYIHIYSNMLHKTVHLPGQNTLSFIILEHIKMFTLVSGLHVCDKVI